MHRIVPALFDRSTAASWLGIEMPMVATRRRRLPGSLNVADGRRRGEVRRRGRKQRARSP